MGITLGFLALLLAAIAAALWLRRVRLRRARAELVAAPGPPLVEALHPNAQDMAS